MDVPPYETPRKEFRDDRGGTGEVNRRRRAIDGNQLLFVYGIVRSIRDWQRIVDRKGWQSSDGGYPEVRSVMWTAFVIGSSGINAGGGSSQCTQYRLLDIAVLAEQQCTGSYEMKRNYEVPEFASHM